MCRPERCCFGARGAPSTVFHPQQENLSSWIPENIKKKECMYFMESPKLSDAG